MSEPSNLLALSNDLAAAVDKAGRSVVVVNARHRITSSGIHWRAGIVVTADHTLKREDDLTVTLPGGETIPAQLAGRDAGTDLAVLKIDPKDLPVAEIGDTAALQVGHLVIAVGRSGEDGIGASVGALSVSSGSWRTWQGGSIDRFVRPDLTLYPGFSGGPLVDVSGRVVGLNTSGLARMSLTVPVSTVDRVIDELLSRGRVSRAYLGVSMQPVRLPSRLRDALQVKGDGGVMVLSVEGDGPADRAGVLIGDVLVRFAGERIQDTDDVLALLGKHKVGQAVAVTVVRGGIPNDLSIEVGERPRRED